MNDETLLGYSADYRDNSLNTIDDTLEASEDAKKHKIVKVVAKSNFVGKSSVSKTESTNLGKANNFKKSLIKRARPVNKYVKNKGVGKAENLQSRQGLNNSKYKIVVGKIAVSVVLLIVTFLGIIIIINRFSSLKDAPAVVSVGNSLPDVNYSEFLAPIVMHDPEPFKDPSKADTQMKISSSIWRCIMKNGTKKYNSFDDRGFSLIPVSEVRDACKELFGPNYNVDFKERVFGPFYSLDAGEENFHISASSNYNSYIPYIKDASKDGDSINLTVGYVLREDPFFSKKTGKEALSEPDIKKCMIYKLKEEPCTNRYFVEEVLVAI